MADAGQMRYGREFGFFVDADDQIVSPLPSRAAGPISHRDERRLQPLQVRDGDKQLFPGRVRFGREELEAESSPVSLENILNVHGSYCGRRAMSFPKKVCGWQRHSWHFASYCNLMT